MSEAMQVPAVAFVMARVDRLAPGPLTLAVSKGLIERRRTWGAAKGEMLTAQDVVMALARDLRGGDRSGVEASKAPIGTLVVKSPSVGIYIVNDIVLAEGYLQGASVYLLREADAVEHGGVRVITEVVTVNAAAWNEARAQA